MTVDSLLLSQCAELCNEEWTVLSAVYPEYTALSKAPGSNHASPTLIRLEVPVEIQEQEIQIESEVTLAGQSQLTDNGTVSIRLRHLPPLIFTLLLPPTYPLRAPPQLAHLHSTNGWLSDDLTRSIRQGLSDIWQEEADTGSSTGSLWRTCEWIHEGAFLPSGPIRITHPKPSLLAKRLEDHDNAVRMDVFSHSKFDCQICLSTVRGAKCLRLNCGHVFCRPCLAEFWSLCIAEGDVDRVMCADPKCVKENRPITEDEVMRVVTAAEAQRWKTIKRKKALEMDPGLVYCPMVFCQSPCPSPMSQRGKERDATAVDDVTMRREYFSLRTCDNCEFSFCILCKRAWHSIHPCSSDITGQFLERYMALEEGDPERLELERRFGKAQLAKLIAKLKEEEENRKWLDLSTTKCPHCATSIEKSYGCNHVTCSRCSTHFCYLCGRKLPVDRPYDHFSERGPCKGQLFQMANLEQEEAEFLVFDED